MSMATSICKYPNAQKQGYEMSLKDDEKRAKGFLEFKEEDAKKNRQHDLNMALIFAHNFS